MSPVEKSVLLIDDDFEYARLLAIHLAHFGYAVETVHNGKDGVERAKQKPDIILLDVIMPVIDGYEVCRRLQDNKETKDIPLIMLTGRDDIEQKLKDLKLKVNGYINKPFDIKELVNLMTKVLK